jgi:hypothetical protein
MAVALRVRGVDPPGLTCGPSPDQPDGYRNVHAGLQRQQEVVSRTPGDQAFVADVELTVRGARLGGPYVHGRGGDRFLYLSWGEVDRGEFKMFRRAKIRLEHLDPSEIDGRTLEVTIELTDELGHPTCASVRPPAAQWRHIDEPPDLRSGSA